MDECSAYNVAEAFSPGVMASESHDLVNSLLQLPVRAPEFANLFGQRI